MDKMDRNLDTADAYAKNVSKTLPGAVPLLGCHAPVLDEYVPFDLSDPVDGDALPFECGLKVELLHHTPSFLNVAFAGSKPSGSEAPGAFFFFFEGGFEGGAMAARHSEHGKSRDSMSVRQVS
jgi:hypothetical protein